MSSVVRGHLLGRVGLLAPDVALRVAAHALISLHKAHEAKIVHRDIKPANLFQGAFTPSA